GPPRRHLEDGEGETLIRSRCVRGGSSGSSRQIHARWEAVASTSHQVTGDRNMTAEIVQENNPFVGAGNGAIAKRENAALVETASQREIAEVQAAMAIAKRFPRDPIAAMDRILQACTRPTLAEGALYSYSRGGSEVSGPSIRLAEVAAQSWGNIQFGIRELEQR